MRLTKFDIAALLEICVALPAGILIMIIAQNHLGWSDGVCAFVLMIAFYGIHLFLTLTTFFHNYKKENKI